MELGERGLRGRNQKREVQDATVAKGTWSKSCGPNGVIKRVKGGQQTGAKGFSEKLSKD